MKFLSRPAVLLLGFLGALAGAAEQPPEAANIALEAAALRYDASLNLRRVVEVTFEHFPQQALIAAFEEEATALQTRAASWIAGYPLVYLQWIDDTVFSSRGLDEIQTGYQIPFWMWGQRSASRKVADEAAQSALAFGRAVKHEVAGLVRTALWSIKLAENRHELAKQVYHVATRLVATVERRVELGDLARSDLLMAESDALEKKTLLGEAELELAKALQAYANLTRLDRLPVDVTETQTTTPEINEGHPAIAAINTVIERAQAEVDLARLSKQGNQPSILLGTNHARGNDRESFSNGTNLVLQIPIGGDDYHAPVIAQANLALSQKVAERETLMRDLNQALLAVRKSLDTDRSLLEIAERRRAIAETQIRMNQLAFEAGEIELINFLKVQSMAQTTIRDALERAIVFRRDLALYNQIVGVTP